MAGVMLAITRLLPTGEATGSLAPPETLVKRTLLRRYDRAQARDARYRVRDLCQQFFVGHQQGHEHGDQLVHGGKRVRRHKDGARRAGLANSAKPSRHRAPRGGQKGEGTPRTRTSESRRAVDVWGRRSYGSELAAVDDPWRVACAAVTPITACRARH